MKKIAALLILSLLVSLAGMTAASGVETISFLGYGKIAAENTTIWSQPDTASYPVTKTTSAGLAILIIDTETDKGGDEWYLVKREAIGRDGFDGYVRAEKVSFLDADDYEMHTLAAAYSAGLDVDTWKASREILELSAPDGASLLAEVSAGEATDSSAAEWVEYSPGQYKVGADLPAGEYVLLTTSERGGYFCVTTDANGGDIVFNDSFAYNSIVTVHDGEYVEFSRCHAVPFDAFYALETIPTDQPGVMLVVGKDIQPGEYKLATTEESRGGYYCIYPNSRQDDILSNGSFENSTYIAVEEGQYLSLSRCIVQP